MYQLLQHIKNKTNRTHTIHEQRELAYTDKYKANAVADPQEGSFSPNDYIDIVDVNNAK